MRKGLVPGIFYYIYTGNCILTSRVCGREIGLDYVDYNTNIKE